MAQNEHTEYRVIFKSTPSALNFNNQSLRSFPYVVIMSDIFGFYPYGELYFADSAGIIVDNIMFVEGLQFEFKMGNDEEGYVGHDFYWSESQINNTRIAPHVSGDNLFIMKSNFSTMDNVRSKAWKDSLLSTVVNDIVTNDFGITDSKKKNILSTTGTDIWYQINSTIRDFLWIHREQAYTSSFPNSPFVTFINSNGEFYFTCLESLFNSQQPIAKYKFSFSEKSILDSDTIKEYNINFVGEPMNKFLYKQKLYTLGKDGTYSNEDKEIQNFIPGSGKTLLRKQLQENYSDYDIFGINENTQDENRLNAKKNFNYINSALPIRMSITVNFNSECVSGKLVDLQIGSSMDKKQIFTELSGSWLIISDKHFIDFDGKPITQLEIAKAKSTIDTSHPFYNDFLS